MEELEDVAGSDTGSPRAVAEMWPVKKPQEPGITSESGYLVYAVLKALLLTPNLQIYREEQPCFILG